MIVWKGSQVVFLLAMIVICAMALNDPAWRHWYDLIFPPLLIAAAIMLLGYILLRR
jgi:hypothetical protein